MINMKFLRTVLCLLIALVVTEGALTTVFMPTSCGVNTAVTTSLQLESATRLTYANNVDCTITFAVTAPAFVLAHFRRFELERQQSGTCNDYVNVHDGGSVSSGTLNTAALCGSPLSTTVYVTSGQQLTVRFVTDSSAVYQGFNLVLTAATNAPCGVDQFGCNNTYCIASELRCDGYDQCGDESDETSCDSINSSSGMDWTPVIVGLSMGLLLVLFVAAFVFYRRYHRNRWRQFTNQHIHREDLPDPDPSYPVTHKYFRGIRGHPNNATYEATTISTEEKKKESEDLKPTL